MASVSNHGIEGNREFVIFLWP